MNKNLFNKKKSKLIFDFGMHPYADTFLTYQDLRKSEPIFPLRCYLNPKTGLIYNEIITSSHERYNLYDYSYTSSNSSYSRNYWIKYSKFIFEIFKDIKIKKVLEVGSNDGFLLKALKKKYSVNGVDASSFMANIARKKGIKTFSLVFNKKNSKEIKKKIGKMDLILANNVFNHANNPYDFIKSAENLLNDKKYFIIEVPYWKNLVKKKQFDQIYHEHVTYITVKSYENLLKKTSFKIIDILETEYHGGSIRIVCQKNGEENKKIIKKYISQENNMNLFNFKTYQKLSDKINSAKYNFLKRIFTIKNQGYSIVGIGAAAKANTFLNYLKIDNNILDFVTDISPFKKGKYTPLSRIPIKDDAQIKKFKKKFYAIILSWNISRILKPKLLKVNKKIKFIDFKV